MINVSFFVNPHHTMGYWEACNYPICPGFLTPYAITKAMWTPPENEWQNVQVHKFDQADGTMSYQCRNCDKMIHYKSYKQKMYLNYDQLKYECDKCGRKYMTKRQLKAHQVRHGEKKHVCSHCSKGFITASELRNHVNTHTGERPYECKMCFKTFSQSSKYYTHLRTVHKKYDCYSCYSNETNCASNQVSPGSEQSPKPQLSSEAAYDNNASLGLEDLVRAILIRAQNPSWNQS